MPMCVCTLHGWVSYAKECCTSRKLVSAMSGSIKVYSSHWTLLTHRTMRVTAKMIKVAAKKQMLVALQSLQSKNEIVSDLEHDLSEHSDWVSRRSRMKWHWNMMAFLRLASVRSGRKQEGLYVCVCIDRIVLLHPRSWGQQLIAHFQYVAIRQSDRNIEHNPVSDLFDSYMKCTACLIIVWGMHCLS